MDKDDSVCNKISTSQPASLLSGAAAEAATAMNDGADGGGTAERAQHTTTDDAAGLHDDNIDVMDEKHTGKSSVNCNSMSCACMPVRSSKHSALCRPDSVCARCKYLNQLFGAYA